MTFGSREFSRRSVSTEPAASWESPRAVANSSERFGSSFIRGALTLPGTLSFLRENGRQILMLAGMIFALGVALLIVIPARYAATALVVVDPREQRVTTDQDVLPGIGQDAAALQSMIEIAKSDGFLKPLIAQLKIENDEDIAGGQSDATRLLEKFRSRLDISRRGLTYVIAFTFTSNRADQAAFYANAVAEAFVAHQRRVRTDATDEAADWLKARLKDLNDRLRSSEDAVAAFRLEHKIVNAGKESTTQQLRVTDLSQQASAARVRTEEAKTRYEQAQRDLKANVDGPAKQDLLSILRAQRSALNDQIAQKKAVLGDRHPDLLVSYSQLSDLNRQIEVERKKNIDTAKSEYEAQLEQQKALEAQLKKVETEMLVDGQALVKLQELQRDAEANRNIYEQFLSRFKSTNEQRQLQNSQTKIASLAIAPLRPTRPPLPLLLAAIMIASLLTSTAAVAVTRRGLDGARVEKPTPASAPEPKPEVLPKLPVWARIPIAASARSASTVWQTQITATADLDASGPLRPVLERISGLPRPGGKIAFVMSVGKGADGFTIARSLSRSAVSHGILSVLIEVQPDIAGAEVPSREYQGNDVTAADLNAVTELLGPAPQATAPEDDIRSEFGLIVIHASSLALQPDAVSIASYADAVMLVVRADEIESGAMRRVTTALSRFEAVPTGLIVREVALSPANSERDRMGLAV